MILAAEVPDAVLGWLLLIISTVGLGVLGWIVRETIRLRNDLIAHMGREETKQITQDKVLEELKVDVEACRKELHDGLTSVHQRIDQALVSRSA